MSDLDETVSKLYYGEPESDREAREAYNKAMIVMDFEEPRFFVNGVQVSGPPAPPRAPRPAWEPCCEAPARLVTCCAYFGPDQNLWSCANCGHSGLVYEIDGTPRDQWPAERVLRHPDAVYETSRGRLAIYRQPLVDLRLPP